MAERDDVGRRALNKVHQIMMVEPDWSVTEDRSFTWWGKDFPQRVSVTEPIESAGFQLFKLVATTPVVENVAINDDTYQKLNVFNADGPALNAAVLDKDGVVSYVASAVVHEGTLADVPGVFAVIAAMQAADAQGKADTLATSLSGKPARRSHPVSGARPDMDEALYVTERLVVPLGQNPSEWAGDEMLNALALMQRGSMLANGNAAGFVAEFPYRGFSSLLKFSTKGRHPHLGNGLHVTLRIPDNPFQSAADVTAGRLNELEAQVGVLTDFKGAWSVGPNNTITFSAFYPTAFFDRGRGPNVALSMAVRAKWVASLDDGE